MKKILRSFIEIICSLGASRSVCKKKKKKVKYYKSFPTLEFAQIPDYLCSLSLSGFIHLVQNSLIVMRASKTQN